MVKLHLFGGFENKPLGITCNMELGHLYSDIGDRKELIDAGIKVGIKERWLQGINLIHYDLWGKPLERAKAIFPLVTDIEFGEDLRMLKGG